MVNEIARTKGVTPLTLYNCSCVCALAAGAVRDAAVLREQYATQAVELLREAIAAGYKNARQLEIDPDFEAVRGQKGYQQLLRQLKADNPVKEP
jgi:hypothetical protein